MGMNRPTQRLRRELRDLAYHQEALAGKLVHIAESLPGRQGCHCLSCWLRFMPMPTNLRHWQMRSGLAKSPESKPENIQIIPRQ